MNPKDVIVLNSHGIGQYAYCDHLPRWGETLSVRGWHIAEDGGKGTNVSVALARLGLSVAYIGKVGCDAWGDLGVKWMAEAGVDISYLYRDPNVTTGTGLILVASDGRNCIIDGDSSSRKLTIDEVTTAIDSMLDSKYFITGFEIPLEVSLAGALLAHKHGMRTVLNPSPLPKSSIESLYFIDYLFINEVEASYLSGNSNLDDLEEIAHVIQNQYQCRNVIITLGSEGSCALIESGKFFKVKSIYVRDVVNTVGAGDGFMSATIFSLLRGKNLCDAMQWASYYAALCVSIDGTIPSYRPLSDVQNFIKNAKNSS